MVTIALRAMANVLVTTSFLVTKAADGFRRLWLTLTGDWEASNKVLDEMEAKTKTFLKAIVDINIPPPSSSWRRCW